MLTERLKNDVIFVTVDGDWEGAQKKRARITDEVAKIYKENGLRVIRFATDENHADELIPAFSAFPYSNRTHHFYCYSYFMIRDLYLYLLPYEFTHVINFQWDGYPINFDAWTDDFLDYDLLGQASGIKNSESDGVYMIGGFTLKSKRASKMVYEKATLNYLKEQYEQYGYINEDIVSNDILTDKKGWDCKDETWKQFWSRVPTPTSFGFHRTWDRPNPAHTEEHLNWEGWEDEEHTENLKKLRENLK